MRLPTRTIRLRLTMIYGGVFLISSAVLLTIGYVLVRNNLHHHHRFPSGLDGLAPALYRSLFGSLPHPSASALRAFQEGYQQARSAALHRLLIEYAGALILMTGVSVGLGWWIAGRALAPLRAITATALRVSEKNLSERIALQGPDDELKELADTFDRMLARLDAAFASQRRFVANASHELRTPLAIMRTEIDVALGDLDASSEELRAMGEAVRETIDRSESLIAALLVLARSDGMRASEEVVDLSELAAGCITDLRRDAEAAGITIDADLAPAAAIGDPELLERMVVNLVDNGIRHNRPEGELQIATRAMDGAAELLVRNSGAVIEPADVQSLTEPFRRLSHATRGFGLGLSIARSVAEAHGGTIELTAIPEGGLLVVVRIPAPASTDASAASRRTLTKI